MISKKIVLRFGKEISGKPVVYRLIKDYDLVFNIIKAKVSPEEEGILIIELTGSKEEYEKGIAYLKETGVNISPFEKEIVRDKKLCTHCTACIAHCPTKALFIKDKKTMEIDFDNKKCIACEACIQVCPFQAMKISF